VLLGLGLTSIVAVTGCGSDNADTAGSGQPKPGASTARPPAVPTDAGTIEPLPTGGPPVGALLSTKEVPVGGGVLVNDQLVIVQPKAGTFKAFDARCPHQGFIVQAPRSGSSVMECPGHNSQFKVADGSLARGPATRGLSAVSVKVVDGYIVEA
jgi:nitrite reductase/ring-hydroxylating ferredoxin subunit